MVGSGVLLILALVISYGDLDRLLVAGLVVGALAHLGFVAAELRGSHPTANATAGVAIMTGGRYAATLRFGLGLVLAALILGALSLVVGGVALAAVGGLLAQAGLVAYEHVFVRAGQEVPLS
jgi:hypothetical protein